jgi:DNA-binding MarR family transcriptional regulator
MTSVAEQEFSNFTDIVDAPEFYIATLQSQIRENMNAILRPFGLKLPDWRILSCLDRQSGLSIYDLSELVVAERSVTSRLVDRLVERGYVRKEVMETDRRFTTVSITSTGCDKLTESIPAVVHLRKQLFAGMSEKEVTALLTSLKHIRRNALSYQRVGNI